MRMMLVRWPEKVERLIWIDCWSPMSASTVSKTGSTACSAGGRSPAWWSRAARPSVFSATVLPPVFGPLTTSARRPPRARSMGTTASSGSSGWRTPSSLTSSPTRTGAPRHRRDSVPEASARSSAAVASTTTTSAAAATPMRVDSSARIRSTSSRSALAASARRLFSSTTASGSTNRVCPELDASCTMPGTCDRALSFTASTGRPPRSVTNVSCRCSRRPVDRASRASSSVTRCRPARSSLRSRRRSGEAVSRRSEPSCSTRRSISPASEASPGSTGASSSASSGAASRCSSSAPRAASVPEIVSAVARSSAGSSEPPRSARSTAVRTSAMPCSDGATPSSSSATASAVRACRAATSCSSGEGTSSRAAAAPCGVTAAFASRSTISGYSNTSSACRSMAASVP